MKIQFEGQVHKQRLLLGLLCGLLPICCILFGLFGANTNYPKWWHSISATYYANSKVWMIGLLVLCSFFFFTYKGYDFLDALLTKTSAISALGIVIFPCLVPTQVGIERVGLFQLPIQISHIIHCAFAAILFASFAIMILCQFTKGQDKQRNKIYKWCGNIIVAFMLNQVITSLMDVPTYWTLINEFFMLEAFAVAWITKSKLKIIKTSRE